MAQSVELSPKVGSPSWEFEWNGILLFHFGWLKVQNCGPPPGHTLSGIFFFGGRRFGIPSCSIQLTPVAFKSVELSLKLGFTELGI